MTSPIARRGRRDFVKMLRSCLFQDGRSVVVDGDPGMRTYSDVLYVPFGHKTPPGLYDRGRMLISSGAHFAAWPHPKPAIEAYVAKVEPALVPEAPDDVIYFYGHHATDHFGHFLFSILARLWALPYGRSSRFKILLLHRPSKAVLNGFAGQILAALGIGDDDLVVFEEPVRLRSVMIPSPAFCENNIAYSAYRSLCLAVGRNLVHPDSIEACDKPIFLSKSRLKSGFSAFINEEEVLNYISKNDIDIVYPEELSIEKQIRIFKERRNILGVVGSAFHTCIFGNPVQMIGLSPRESITSNQVLIDRLCGNRSLYVHSDLVRRTGKSDAFENIFLIEEPQKVAEDLLRMLDAQIASGSTGKLEGGWTWSTDLAESSEHAQEEKPSFDFYFRLGQTSLTSLGEGWSLPEETWVWSDGQCSTLRLPAPPEMTNYQIRVHARPFTWEQQPNRTLQISTPSRLVAAEIVSTQFTTVFTLQKEDLDSEGWINLILSLDHCPSPSQIGLSTDRRFLGIALQRVTVEIE